VRPPGRVYDFEFCGGPWAGRMVLQLNRPAIELKSVGGKYVWNARDEQYDWKPKTPGDSRATA